MPEVTSLKYFHNAYVHVDDLGAIDTIETMFNCVASGDRLVIIDAESLKEQIDDMEIDTLDKNQIVIVNMLNKVLAKINADGVTVGDLQIYS